MGELERLATIQVADGSTSAAAQMLRDICVDGLKNRIVRPSFPNVSPSLATGEALSSVSKIVDTMSAASREPDVVANMHD